jgi:hypothetical protein
VVVRRNKERMRKRRRCVSLPLPALLYCLYPSHSLQLSHFRSGRKRKRKKRRGKRRRRSLLSPLSTTSFPGTLSLILIAYTPE